MAVEGGGRGRVADGYNSGNDDFDDDLRFDEDSDGGGGGDGAPAAAPAGVQHAGAAARSGQTRVSFHCLCTGVNVHNEACALGPLILINVFLKATLLVITSLRVDLSLTPAPL